MTNVEAIEYIKKNCYGEWCEDDWREAMDMAIEALKCSETPKSSEQTSETAQADHTADFSKKVDGDCISRQAAIDLFPNDALEWDTKGGYIAPHLARRMIEELPPVQPDHTADISKKAEKEDCVSRQAAIKAADSIIERDTSGNNDVVKAMTAWKEYIKEMPPAQPDVPDINVIIDTIKNAINASTGNDAYMVGLRNGMRWCLSALTDKEPEYEDMPSAQPEERKKGAWILGFDNQYLEKYYFCSKCGSRKYMEDKPLDNFCQNCGADMRGEQDG